LDVVGQLPRHGEGAFRVAGGRKEVRRRTILGFTVFGGEEQVLQVGRQGRVGGLRLQDGVAYEEYQEELVHGGAGKNKLVQKLPGRQLPVKAVRLHVEEPAVEHLRPCARAANRARVFDHRGRRRSECFRPPRVVVDAERPREAVAELFGAGGGKGKPQIWTRRCSSRRSPARVQWEGGCPPGSRERPAAAS